MSLLGGKNDIAMLWLLYRGTSNTARNHFALHSFFLGIPDLKDDADKSIDDLRLSDAVTADKDTVTPRCFKNSATELRPAVEHLHIMTRKYHSELFQSIWRMQVQQVSSDATSKRKPLYEFV